MNFVSLLRVTFLVATPFAIPIGEAPAAVYQNMISCIFIEISTRHIYFRLRWVFHLLSQRLLSSPLRLWGKSEAEYAMSEYLAKQTIKFIDFYVCLFICSNKIDLASSYTVQCKSIVSIFPIPCSQGTASISIMYLPVSEFKMMQIKTQL